MAGLIRTGGGGGIDIDGWQWINAADHGYNGEMEDDDLMDLIREHPNSVIILPEGQYPIRTELDWEDDPDAHRIAIVGEPHAELVVDSETVDRVFRLGNTDGGAFEKLSLHNLSLVVDADAGYDAGWGRWYIDQYIDNRNLWLEGQRDYYNLDGDKFGYYANLMTEEGVGWHQNINLPDGDRYSGGGQFEQAIGVGSEVYHVGANYWVGCYLENWWDNGMYLKDSIGTNIVYGCHVRNCGGGGHIRIGETDQIIASTVVADYEDPDRVPVGTLIDLDEAKGSAVTGVRLRNENSTTPSVRVRTAADSVTLRDIYLEHNVSNYSMQFSASSTDHEAVDDETHKNGIVSIDGARIIDSGKSNVQAASIRSDRPYVNLESVSIECTNSSSTRAPLQIKSGRCFVENSRLEGPAEHDVILGGSDGGNTVNRAVLTRTELSGGIYMYYHDDSIESLTLRSCDLRDVDDYFPAQSASDGVDRLVRRDNLGYQTENSGMAEDEGHTGEVYSWYHGLDAEPDSVVVTPANSNAQGSYHVTTSETHINLGYTSDDAPDEGVDLQWYWTAEVRQ